MSLFTKIIYPNNINTRERQNIFFIGILLIITGTCVYIWLPKFIINYMFIIFGILITLIITYCLLDYKNNESTPPSYESINNDE